MGESMMGSPLNLVIVLGALALLPFLLIMVTSFVKVAVVLSLLRTAIGTQQVPPTQVITGLAIVLSIYIMAPVGIDAYQAVWPRLQELEQQESAATLDDYAEIGERVAQPLRAFLIEHSDGAERQLLYELAVQMRTEEQAESLERDDLIIAIPAFVVTELEEAFTIGFLLFIPFIIVDLVVANILLSLGMHMLSPTTISLPFKLLLFVLVDGWFLVVKGLVLGYA
ncbi:MAG: type III secretion system export apparatus subunit SctR [Myxococcota bacterium]